MAGKNGFHQCHGIIAPVYATLGYPAGNPLWLALGSVPTVYLDPLYDCPYRVKAWQGGARRETIPGKEAQKLSLCVGADTKRAPATGASSTKPAWGRLGQKLKAVVVSTTGVV